MYMHCRKKFGDLDLDIDIAKSFKLHISMNIDARALKFPQNLDLLRALAWQKVGDLDHDIDIDIDKY